MTGEMPGTDDEERGDGWKDFFAFRDGTVDVDGNPNRHTIPGYIMHDVRGWSHHPLHTFLSKLSPFWAFASRVAQNRSYYGDMIYNEDEDMSTRASQIIREGAKEFAPLSVQNFLEASKRDETNVAEMARNAFGINPANREITRSNLQNRLAEILARRGKTAQTPEQQEQRERLGDILTKLRTGADASDAIETAIEHGDLTMPKYNKILRRAAIFPFVEKFKMLSPDQALDVFERGTPWERGLLIDILNQKLERQAAAAAKEGG
jgi:hypothetical protein